MNNLEKLLLFVAFAFKILNPPHFIKYVFFLLLKTKQILVLSNVKISNAKIYLNLGDFIDYWIFINGLYEGSWLIKATRLIKGRVLIDIGANIGIYTLSLFRNAKYIYAFEPERENYRRLVNNLKINSITNVKTLRKAVSNQTGKSISLYINRDNKGWHSTSIPYSNDIQRVESITLDYFIEKNKIKDIGLIKIDVEGGELNVLAGSRKILKKLRPTVLIEFNKPLSRMAGHNLIQIYKLLIQYNYQSYRLIGDKLIQIKLSDVPNINNENILFIEKNKYFESLR